MEYYWCYLNFNWIFGKKHWQLLKDKQHLYYIKQPATNEMRHKTMENIKRKKIQKVNCMYVRVCVCVRHEELQGNCAHIPQTRKCLWISTNFSIYYITLKCIAIFLDSAMESLTWLLTGRSTKCWNKSASILLSVSMEELNYTTLKIMKSTWIFIYDLQTNKWSLAESCAI